MLKKPLENPNNEFITGIRTAVLVDGAFFLKRYHFIYGNQDTEKIVKDLEKMVYKHVGNNQLYRILYYDCYPFDKNVYHPLAKKQINFSKTSEAKFREKLYKELKVKRKVALRLGYLKENYQWIIRKDKLKDIINGKITINDIKYDEIRYDLKQKGVDIRIGLDIASLAYKRLVQQIVLISGDSDFIPIAKTARREGIDFILDPMWNKIDEKLLEHIDGCVSYCKKPSGYE